MWFLKRTFTSFRWMTLVTSLRWLLWLSVLGSCSTVNSFNLPSNAAGQMNTPQFILVADSAFGRRMWKYALNFKTFSFKLTATFQVRISHKDALCHPSYQTEFCCCFKNGLQELSPKGTHHWSPNPMRHEITCTCTWDYNQEFATHHTWVYLQAPSFFSGIFCFSTIWGFCRQNPTRSSTGACPWAPKHISTIWTELNALGNC